MDELKARDMIEIINKNLGYILRDINECDKVFLYVKNAQFALSQYRRPAPENKPLTLEQLTLEQLRKMDGEPVWVCGMPGHKIKWAPGWRIIDGNRVAHRRWNDTSMYLYFADYGRTWLAYARKPEQEEHHA